VELLLYSLCQRKKRPLYYGWGRCWYIIVRLLLVFGVEGLGYSCSGDTRAGWDILGATTVERAFSRPEPDIFLLSSSLDIGSILLFYRVQITLFSKPATLDIPLPPPRHATEAIPKPENRNSKPFYVFNCSSSYAYHYS